MPLVVVNFFGFLVIARTLSNVYGRNLVEIDPTSLPDLSKQLRDQNNNQKHKKHENQNVQKKIAKLKFKDSRHAQLSIYAVFHEESDFQAKNKQFRRPEAEKQEKRNQLLRTSEKLLVPLKGSLFRMFLGQHHDVCRSSGPLA